MSAALDRFLARAPQEEGVKKFAYNDATGKQVTCQPIGNLSIGEGINLETGLDSAEIQFLLAHRAGLVEQQLLSFPWYAHLPPGVQSVLIDIGFNEGVHGLLGFPHMLAALAKDPPDYATASAECSIVKTNPRVDAQRYAPLRAILLSGA
jgi:hypothetical protein